MSDVVLGAGIDVLSYCGRCKMPLNHVIIAMKDEKKIGKCKCRTCGAEHLYRDPDKPVKPTTRKTAAKKVPIEEVWKAALETATGDSKEYSMQGIFVTGDILDHSKFGKGLVQREIGSNKVEVIFETDLKILACAR